MLQITAGKGFQITFENGWTASVQFGTGNYCENRDVKGQRFYEDQPLTHDVACKDAEVARWPEGSSAGGHDDIRGWQTPDEVAEFITETANLGGSA